MASEELTELVRREAIAIEKQAIALERIAKAVESIFILLTPEEEEYEPD